MRWREPNADGSTIRRKVVIGTVEQFRTKVAALKACEFLRSTINRETRTPRTMAELVNHYTEQELPSKTPYTREVYEGYMTKWIVPKWGACSLSDVRIVAVESWLGTLKLSNGSRAKVRNIMSALYAHAVRWEFFDRNPITLVRQSAKRNRAPDVLTAEELKALLSELTGIHRVMVFVASTTGLRVSELLALRWQDCDFESGEIRLTRGIVRQRETAMKTEASRKPVPMEGGLADVLMNWRTQCAYNQPEDYIEDVATVQSLIGTPTSVSRWTATFRPLRQRNGKRSAASWAYWTQMDPRGKLDSLQAIEKMVGAIGFEPMTSTV